MLFQSLASIFVGLECLLRLTPDIYIDTMGAPFSYPLADLLGLCRVVAYVHYPIISADMLEKVREQRPSYNNDGFIANSVTISSIKLLYYKLFAYVYSFVGSFASKVIVNSSWTEGHISQLWRLPPTETGGDRSSCIKTSTSTTTDTTSGDRGSSEKSTISEESKIASGRQGGVSATRLFKIFPPCNTSHLKAIPLGSNSSNNSNNGSDSNAGRSSSVLRERVVLSIGQFRPEKDHSLQLRALKALLSKDRK
jgi:glycosyltransferase involved in cell wall biosynthesis